MITLRLLLYHSCAGPIRTLLAGGLCLLALLMVLMAYARSADTPEERQRRLGSSFVAYGFFLSALFLSLLDISCPLQKVCGAAFDLNCSGRMPEVYATGRTAAAFGATVVLVIEAVRSIRSWYATRR